MKKDIEFYDPLFTSSLSHEIDGVKVTYPHVEKKSLKEVFSTIRSHSNKYYSSRNFQELQAVTDKVDAYFADYKNPEIQELIIMIKKLCGFSIHDIERWGLGLFSLFVNYEPKLRGSFIIKAIKENGLIETCHGYLKRYGIINPFNRWKEPELLSHFVSGNVVGYTAVLSKIGLPVKMKGTAQIMKLPSSASFFPLVYLEKLGSVDPDLRKTIACGYWKGGDDTIEKSIIEESDAINILSSDQSIRDLKFRIKRYHKGMTALFHGHKIGIAYIAKEFIENPVWLEQTINGLVTDISAFDGGACCTVKNIYIQGEPRKFAEQLFTKLNIFAKEVSEVSENSKPIGRSLYQVYCGSNDVLSSEDKNSFVRIRETPEFWKPDELYRYVQVMKVHDEREVYNLLKGQSSFLQTAIIAVPDNKIIQVMMLFGKAGLSNIHYPGSAPLLNVYEEPHDGEFDSVRVRYNYSARFAATNFKTNKDWLS